MLCTASALLTISLLAHLREPLAIRQLLENNKTPHTIELKNSRSNCSGGFLTIQLSDNKIWKLSFKEPHDPEICALAYNDQLKQKSPLIAQQDDELLTAYEIRIAKQKQELLKFAQDQIEENINAGSISLAGFGAIERVCEELYTNKNAKWRGYQTTSRYILDITSLDPE